MEKINSIKEILNENDIKLITEAIKTIEMKTTGKIKIYIGEKMSGDPLAYTRNVFEQLGLRKLIDKNGVIFVITLRDKKITVFGDDGINTKVKGDFWQNIKDAIVEKFNQSQFALGLIGGINLIGEKFMEFFMRDFEKINGEIDNDTSIIFEE